jgi:hypothetical protein
MTRSTQKQNERKILSELLSAIHLQPDGEPVDGEKPDFVIRTSGTTVGIELTTYQSGRTVAGVPKRAVEAAWDDLEQASQKFQTENADLHGVYILFRFGGMVPPRHEHAKFFDEIREFVQSIDQDIGIEFVEFWRPSFASPLMKQYLQAIVLRRSERSEWDSNLTAGFVDPPADIIAKIVADKSAKTYRPADEFWLVIADSGQPSEMILPIAGISEFNARLQLRKNLAISPFARVYAFTAMGLFCWDRPRDNWKLNTRDAVP